VKVFIKINAQVVSPLLLYAITFYFRGGWVFGQRILSNNTQ